MLKKITDNSRCINCDNWHNIIRHPRGSFRIGSCACENYEIKNMDSDSMTTEISGKCSDILVAENFGCIHFEQKDA